MATQGPVIDDVTLAELERDPNPFYARMRREQPVAYLPIVNQWMIARWEDCDQVGRNEPRIGSMVTYLHEYFGDNILTADGPLHKWLRDGVDPPLRPKAVQGYIEERARPVAAAYIDRLLPQGRADATLDLLELISVRVIGDVLGMTDVDDDTLQRWFHALNDGLVNFAGDPEVHARSEGVKAELDEYMEARVEQLIETPDDSGLSHMIHTGLEDGAPKRTYEELVGTIQVIVLGGLQEPGHGAAASLLGLLLDPDQVQMVLDDPAKAVPAAVHEGLRWIPPFQVVEREVLEDIEVAGVTIPAGAEISLLVASANRDESRYEDPDRFDIRRKRITQAAFGYGIHFCSGHFITRRLEQIMLEETFARLPGLRLDPDREPSIEGFHVRGVKNLPVLWDA